MKVIDPTIVRRLCIPPRAILTLSRTAVFHCRSRYSSEFVIASFRSRNGEALKVAEKFQGGGHANAAGALLPKSVRNVPDGVEYLRQILNIKNETQQTRLNSLENLFAEIETGKK